MLQGGGVKMGCRLYLPYMNQTAAFRFFLVEQKAQSAEGLLNPVCMIIIFQTIKDIHTGLQTTILTVFT